MEELPPIENNEGEKNDIELEPRSPEETAEWMESAAEQLELAKAEVEHLKSMLEGDLSDEERIETTTLLMEAQELVEGLTAMTEEEGDLNKIV